MRKVLAVLVAVGLFGVIGCSKLDNKAPTTTTTPPPAAAPAPVAPVAPAAPTAPATN